MLEIIGGEIRSQPHNNNYSYLEELIKDADLEMYNVVKYGVKRDGTTDDSAGLNAALYAAAQDGGGIVYVPDGVYAIKSTLKIYKNTALILSKNAVIKRMDNFSPMLLNGDGGVGGYDGDGNIIIDGGVWDGNKDQFPTQFSHMLFGHARNIIVQNCIMLNNYNSHFIELNAVSGGKVVNCIFDGFSGERRTEALQIDLMLDENTFPYFGPYDKTPCRDILVQGCTFRNCDRGVGSHTTEVGYPHTNIRILGNHFENLVAQGIRGYNYHNTIIANNTFLNCGEGIEMRAASQNAFRWTITGNVIEGASRLGYGIWLLGATGEEIFDCTVTGNTIRDTVAAGIRASRLHLSTISGNAITFAGNSGITLIYGCTRNTVFGNTIRTPGNQGISLFDGCSRNTIFGNNIYNPTNHGIAVNSSVDNNVTGNTIWQSGGYGVLLTASASDNTVNGNTFRNTTNHSIRISDNSHNNNVQGNTIRGSAVGISLTNTCDNNFVTNNDLRNSGGLQDNGVSTVTTAGNRV
ncbi:parallel beta-helix repeat-containing protein [Caldalkalibacillus thermarum TA2.A1]|uniref:Parallel beta-helix repeat-containing protein n=1 Tax=Caldalkalibacillus thermarum (strain TA2.A1) TaxID=986075 RepID=F5L4J6_CALTT|nr:right-handed parallel beta-helix repeat-containing protein [Caldalkalibacillus thermarum]EGL83742.1 parallel beta-helix repeat-containing protein [Caldalkalibacillus thermarum TA2.A1]QZT33979.1 right-handed parallel beta-helix repeat-containing protein [Caldalkalibacillus thermarum TA2.A1]